MLEAQRYLEARFAALRDARSGPVYFLEHGLTQAALEELLAHMRAAIGLHPVEAWYWDAHKLPLIVTATEVGYRYRGAGTDFWPVLEEQLGVRISGPGRQRIRNLFKLAAATFRGAHPPTTPWTEAFHLIAWPITHALVPLEFHRPLARTLATLRESIAGLDDDSLYRAIRLSAGNSPARFLTLLESRSLVVSIVRSLLGAGTLDLSPETTGRIAIDLTADQQARRSLAAARRFQDVAPQKSTTTDQVHPSTPSVTGRLHLRFRDKVPALEASFPPLEPELSSRLRRAVRRRRFSPRLWGVTARIPSEQLLSGLPFAVKLEAAPASDAPLLPELQGLDIEDDLRETLSAFTLRLSEHLLFTGSPDTEIARHVQGPSISGTRPHCLLTLASSATLARVPVLGRIGPYSCHVLDPADARHCEALVSLGYQPRFGVSVALAGSPPLDRNASPPAFLEGDRLIVAPRRPHPDGLLVEFTGHSARAFDDEVVSLGVSPGDCHIRVSSGGESREIAFRGLSAPVPSPPPACVVDSRSQEMTVQALMNGSLTFTIESFAPLADLALTVALELADTRLSATASIGTLPQTISSDQEPFVTLLNDATRTLLLQSSPAVLHLSVGHLCARSWLLERHIRPCWWERAPGGRVALMSELGEMAYGTVAATAPHLPPASHLRPSDQEAFLLAPIGPESAEYGPAAPFATLCIAPRAMALEAPRVPAPRLTRRRRSEVDAGGLEDLVEAFLRWSLAEADSLTAEFRRRQVANAIDHWVAELCCGATWSALERGLPGEDPWDLLLAIGHDRALGRDSYYDLPDEVWRETLSATVSILRTALPRLWSLTQAPWELTEGEWLLIEHACDTAYKVVGARYEQAGRSEVAAALREADASADFATTAWQAALEAVVAESALAALAAHLVPTDSARGLMALDLSGMSLDDITEELSRWSRGSRKALSGDVPGEGTLRAIVALWTDPAVAVTLDWRTALETLLAERSVSRAARYLALRYRESRQRGPE